jgi:hypothetical protein
MNERRSYLPLLAAIGLAIWLVTAKPFDGPAPAPGPAPAAVDLVAAFATNDDRAERVEHALTFATICRSLADCLEYDAGRSEPLLKTGLQVDDLRRGLRQTRMRGWSFLAKYPALGSQTEAFLAGQVGTSGGPLSAEDRAKWISAFRTLAAAAEYAASQHR